MPVDADAFWATATFTISAHNRPTVLSGSHVPRPLLPGVQHIRLGSVLRLLRSQNARSHCCEVAILQALDVAGTYGVLSLFGILPAAAVWSQRYGRPNGFSDYRAVPGEKLVVIVVGCAAFGVILNQAVSSLWGKY